MRIGIDCRIAHYTPGGTGVYTRRLVQALAGLAGKELVLFEAAKARQPIVPGARRRPLFTPSHHRWEQVLLPMELLATKLDVFHSTDYIPPFVRRCRSVITVHDLAFLRWPEHLTSESRRYFNGQIRRAVRSADAIIAVSHVTKRDLVELVGAPADKITVVYEAAGLEIPPADGSGDYVLFAGTFEPRKNLPRLIEAFAEVRRRGYQGQLILAGQPGWNAEATLEAVARHSDYVRTCPLDPRLYTAARLLAFPSIYEGFGLPVLEAMSCGLPVLTSNVSSLPEIAGDAALTVDPEDVHAIADGIWRLLKDNTLASALREKGRARAAEFSWERAAEETLQVYHSLA